MINIEYFRYELYDYPPAIAKPYASFSEESNGALNYQLRHLPLPRYHLDPVMENGSAVADSCDPMPIPSSPATAMVTSGHENKTVDAAPYDRHYSTNDLGLLRFHDDRDRHNDSGYSTRPGESSQGPSPSLSGIDCRTLTSIFICSSSLIDTSLFPNIDLNNKRLVRIKSIAQSIKFCEIEGPAESMEGDGMRIAASGIRADRHFHSHFTRDLAQTLPVSATSTNINLYPRVRFAIPSPEEQTERNGVTISSSSLV